MDVNLIQPTSWPALHLTLLHLFPLHSRSLAFFILLKLTHMFLYNLASILFVLFFHLCSDSPPPR